MTANKVNLRTERRNRQTDMEIIDLKMFQESRFQHTNHTSKLVKFGVGVMYPASFMERSAYVCQVPRTACRWILRDNQNKEEQIYPCGTCRSIGVTKS